ncbi:FmdB family zinc ribbon protein [Phytoactinopolyspora limicola]|uniref:FmdB family zinc ribbon protein n=1 Tax=Phytoactinopolyspora limicola TaxID=2715536 RepID=UPI00140D381F|nr:FmdB family zinc ribbon protein [Phytoactinopolyspora limicola]
MAIYEYCCTRCGVFEVIRAIGSAPTSHTCDECGTNARRFYSTPNFNRGSNPLTRALDRAEKSQDEPEVVTRVPPQRPQQRRFSDPRQARLPAP